MRRRGLRSPIVTLLVVVLGGIGLVGAYRYWESYYQHRGFATVDYLPHAHRGRLVDIDFYSAALGRKADYLAYLPPGYGDGQRYPVYYLLHGSPGRPKVFVDIASMDVRMDNLISQHRMRPMILVMPDGRIGGSAMSDSEWANTPAGQYESYVLNVVTDVDHRFAALPDRHDRVIAGFSAGAYGATNIALHNPSVFAGLQSWSGYYLQTRSGVFRHADRATLAYNSPLDYAHRLSRALRADPLRAFLFVGRDDDDSPQISPMARALAQAGAEVSYALYPGGHDWQLWHSHIDQMLILASRDTVLALTHGRAPALSLTPGVVPIPNGTGRRHGRARRLSLIVAPILKGSERRLRHTPSWRLIPSAGDSKRSGHRQRHARSRSHGRRRTRRRRSGVRRVRAR